MPVNQEKNVRKTNLPDENIRKNCLSGENMFHQENIEKDRVYAFNTETLSGEGVRTDGKHIDHKVPLDAGGSTAKSNTRVVSAKVNKGWRKTRPSMYTKKG